MISEIFIVSWIAVNVFMVDCCAGQPLYTTDDYGIKQINPCYTQAVACYDTDRKEMSREFLTREAAEGFAEGASDLTCGNLFAGNSCVENLVIERIEVEDLTK